MNLLIGVLLACVAIATGTTVSYDGYKVFQVKPRTEIQLNELSMYQNKDGFDFWSRVHKANIPITVMVAPKEQKAFTKQLLKNKIPYKILIENVDTSIQEENASLESVSNEKLGRIDFTKYLRHNEINDYLKDLTKNYPTVASTEIIGQSFENRNLTIIKISSGGNGTKPAILVDAGIHAREWIAPAVALYIINQLVENSNNSVMFENVDWYIIPSLNPDGYEYTFTSDRYWRKTRSTTASILCPGADPNRNFEFHWMENGASSWACSDVFAGEEAFSEKETQALRDFVLPKKDSIKLYLTFHSYGPYILYPWGYTSDLPSDWKELQSLAEDVNDAISAVGDTDYEIGSSTNVLYAAAGGSDDWCKGVGGVQLSYTIELPGGGSAGFNPPPSSILPIVTETWEGVKVYQKYIENKFVNNA